MIFKWLKIKYLTGGIKFSLLLHLYLLNLTLLGQNISPSIDSIHKSTIRHEEKNQFYFLHLKDLESNQNFTQLGHDAHQIAKWFFLKKVTQQEAIIVAKKAVEARKKAIPYNPEFLRRSLYNLGNFNRQTKRYAKAITIYKELLNVRESSIAEGLTYTQIGKCYSKLNDPYKAINYLEQSFSFFDSIKDRNHIIRNHINIVYDYKALRNQESSKKAIQHLFIADSLVRKFDANNFKRKYLIYHKLGALYQDSILDHGKAFFYFNQALNEAIKLNDPIFIGKIYFSLGVTQVNKDPSKAIAYFKQSLNYTENPNVELNYWMLGKTYHKLKMHSSAQENYLKALSYFFPNSEITDSWTPTKEQLSKTKDKVFLLEVLKSQIRNFNAHGNASGDINYYLKAKQIVATCDQIIDIILNENLSKNTKLLWRAVTAEIYILGLEACLQLEDYDFAFFLMEKSKALLLMQDIDRRKTKIPKEILEKQLHFENELANLQSKISNQKTVTKTKDSLASLLFTKRENFQHFKDSLISIYPGYFSNTPLLPKIISSSNLKLNSDEVILQFSVSSTVDGETPKGYGMLITAEQKHLYKIDDIETLITNIYTLRKLLQQPFTTSQQQQDYYAISNSIYRTLFPDQVQQLIANKKLTLITDHILGNIPFEALIIDPKNNTYLIEKCEITYEYSLSFKEENKKIKRAAKKDFLGIAPIKFDSLTTLKNSRKELQVANDFYSGYTLLDEKATKSDFLKLAKDYKILHLATHANASDSIMPWIAFKNDRLLLPELNAFKNQAELVVLSACNTSLGKLLQGEGINSLARGFFKSGANTVIPSLWSTNDKATATITSDFYKNLSEGQTKSAALRTAKLNYLKNNTDAEASPHYWASLILIGDSGTLLPATNYWMFLWIGLGLIALIFAIYHFSLYKKK